MNETATTSEAMWHAFNRELRAFLRSRLPSDADALQDVFMRVHEKIGKVREAERFQSWVYQIARNAIADFYRRSVPQPEGVAEDAVAAECFETEETNKNVSVAAWLPLLIENLPQASRDAVRMYEIEGLSQAKMASRLGISLPATKSRVQRGRRQLEELLRQSCKLELDRRGNVIECKPAHANSCGATACGCSD